MTSERKRFEVLLEDLESKFSLILEGISTLNERVERLEEDMRMVKDAVIPVKPIKIVVAEHETRLNRIEKRLAV